MSDEFNGWGSSTVATAYIYYRLHHILDNQSNEVLLKELSSLYSELATNFHTDTGIQIGVHLGWNKFGRPPRAVQLIDGDE